MGDDVVFMAQRSQKIGVVIFADRETLGVVNIFRFVAAIWNGADFSELYLQNSARFDGNVARNRLW